MKDISLPLKWLIHEFDYFEHSGTDDYSNVIYADPLKIKNTRVDESTTFSRDATQNKIESNAVIFIDAKHSSPLPEFKEESKIMFKNREYTIKKVIPFYHPHKDAVRHYEIEVI